MAITTTTHLNFRGTPREALHLNGEVFGGHVHVTTYGELGMPQDQPDADRVVFGEVRAENGFRVMAYDVPGGEGPAPATDGTRRAHGTTITDRPFFVSVSAATLDEAAGHWRSLAADATIVEDLAPSAWSPGFGMLTDRFGVTWVFGVDAPAAG
jgi:PhnB protein